MEIGPLTVASHPAPEDVQCLDDRLYAYNAHQTGVDDGQWLAIFVRDDRQRLSYPGRVPFGVRGKPVSTPRACRRLSLIVASIPPEQGGSE